MFYDVFKFTLGFFCGIILYYTVFHQLRKFGLKRLTSEEIFVRLSDRPGTNLVYRTETESEDGYLINLDRDVHYRSDNATLANQLSEQVRILCAVLVDYRYARDRVLAINATWGGRCSELVLFTTRARTPVTNFKHYILSMQDTHYVDNHRQRILEVLSKVNTHHQSEFDWLVLATDDVYFIMENLRYFLSEQNASLPLYFGQFNPLEYFVLRYYRTNSRFSFSIVLSNSTLNILRSKLNETSCDTSDVTGEVYEDLCMDKMGVKSLSGRDKHGLERFNIVIPDKWGTHISDRDIQLQDVRKISDFPISFRYLTPPGMYAMELMTYHVRPFGILRPKEEVN